METYHKIQTVFKRDPETNFKTLLEGEYSFPEFEYLKDNDWVFTEKVDGLNMRVLFGGEGICFAGKTDHAEIPVPLNERLIEIFAPLLDTFKDIFNNPFVCLYGEGYGEGYGLKIQKGGVYTWSQDFVLFDIKINETWLQRKDVERIAERLGLDIVPIIGHGTLEDMVDLVKSGFNSKWGALGPFKAEGVVARPKVELKKYNGSRVITKLKYKDFAF